jgi:biopolymer transport protein ExbD
MARTNRSGGQNGEVDIAPLIDVVFLLLVFFMSIWQAAHMEVQAQLQLPSALQGDPEQQQDQDRMVVNIDENGDYFVANRRLTQRELTGVLYEEAERSRDAEGFSTRQIFIRGDAYRPFEDVQTVMRICRELRIWKLALRTTKPEE